MDTNTLGDLFRLLWPDYGQLWHLELSGINALVISIILVVTFAFLTYLVIQSRTVFRRISEFQGLLEGANPDDLMASREELRQKAALSNSGTVKNVWREFDETLVPSPDNKLLWNTVDADYFFNSESLAGEVMHNRVLSVAPSVLTAIGVLGTFVGLTTGLNGLELSSDADVETLKNGIDDLIGGAAIAFMTSVWGVAMSLVANVVEKLFERRISKNIRGLQGKVDALYRRHAPEQSLVKIMGSTQDSADALNQLHERIGNKLQEAVQGISAEMQTAVASAIEKAMTPALDVLVTSTSQQSTEVFEKLVSQFSESFQQIGHTQAERLDVASQGITSSMQDMSSHFTTMVGKFSGSFEEISRQQTERLDSASAEVASTMSSASSDFSAIMKQIREQSSAQQIEATKRSSDFQHQLEDLLEMAARERDHTNNIVARLMEVVDAAGTTLSTTSTELRASVSGLDGVSKTFSEASTTISGQISNATRMLADVTDGQNRSVQLLQEQTQELAKFQTLSTQAAESLKEASRSSNEGFAALREHQTAFLADLKRNFDELANGSKLRVEALTQSMNKWLSEYSSAVSDHTESRMDEWNKHSREYASEMLRATNALSSAIDELEGWMQRGSLAASTSS